MADAEASSRALPWRSKISKEAERGSVEAFSRHMVGRYDVVLIGGVCSDLDLAKDPIQDLLRVRLPSAKLILRLISDEMLVEKREKERSARRMAGDNVFVWSVMGVPD